MRATTDMTVAIYELIYHLLIISAFNRLVTNKLDAARHLRISKSFFILSLLSQNCLKDQLRVNTKQAAGTINISMTRAH